MPLVSAKFQAQAFGAGRGGFGFYTIGQGRTGRIGRSGSGAADRPASPLVNLVIATPCFGGQISVLYAASLFKLQKLVRSYSDLNLKILFKDGDALITRARASLFRNSSTIRARRTCCSSMPISASSRSRFCA